LEVDRGLRLDLRSAWLRFDRFAAHYNWQLKLKSPPNLNISGLFRCSAYFCNITSAEREGFEPTVGSSPTAVFKTAAINRSAISPGANIGEWAKYHKQSDIIWQNEIFIIGINIIAASF
jgi:hypothetical protein